MCYRVILLLVAVLFLAAAGHAQQAEQRPAAARSAAPAWGSRASNSGDHSRFVRDPDNDLGLSIPYQVGPVGITGPRNANAAPAGPTYVYAHGDSNWYPSSWRPSPTKPSNTIPPAQTKPSVPDQFRQLVQSQWTARTAQPGQPHLQVSSTSIADIARQVRAQRATEDKSKIVIKQDAEGKVVMVPRKR